MSRVLLVGASGLVGQAVLQLALRDIRITRVIAPTRRPLQVQPRLDNPVVDFEDLPADAPWWRVDAVICTLGSTMRQAGSREAFRRVDLDYPLAAAQLARRGGARSYALNSAMGANRHSRVFYSRTKGEVEQGLIDLHYPSLTIVRPGLIGGQRGEFRLVERVAGSVLGALDPVLPPAWRVVPPEAIARALLESALAGRPGVQIIESAALVTEFMDKAATERA